MLERVAVCVEPAAQHIFRRLEHPTRTNRALTRSFWKHNGDDTTGPAWWPEYLHNVRRSSEARLEAERDVLTGVASAGLFAFNGIATVPIKQPQRRIKTPIQCGKDGRTVYDGSRQDRPYSRSYRQLQQELPALISRNDVRRDYTEALQGPNLKSAYEEAVQDTKSAREAFVATSNITSITPSVSLSASKLKPGTAEAMTSVLEGSSSAFDVAWRTFVSLQEQGPFAARVLAYMSRSSRRIDHERAVRAYKLISREDRTEKIYAHAMKTAVSRGSQLFALELNREALVDSMGKTSSRILFTYLVRNNLWNTLAHAYEDVRNELNVLKARGIVEKDGPWAHLWTDIDAMVDLPQKLLLLARRVENKAGPVSPFKEPRVRQVAKALLLRAVSSPRIMAILTGSGFTSLFQEYFALGFAEPNHYHQAIRTLLSMISSRNRSQLAALAYRNLRFRFPSAAVPRWIFGSLISIFTEAGQPSQSLLYLLDEFKLRHGRPDARAYQKVMTACARLGDVENVNAIFSQLCRDHGQPSKFDYLTPLIYVHARIGDVAGAQTQFDRLSSEFNLKPNTYCWNILVAAHARARDPSGAFKVFHNMRRSGVPPDAHTLGTLMGMSANIGDSDTVHNLVNLARKHNISGTTQMVDTLVHSYCLNDELDSAKQLVEAATRMNLAGSSTRMWNTLLRHYAFQADSDSVLQVQERMREMSVKPDGMTYAALMSALVVIGKTKDAAKILRSLHFNEHLTATLFHYSIVLHGYAQEGNRDMVSVVYNEILERFPRPSMSARLAVLHSQSGRDFSIWRDRQVKTGKPRLLQLPHALDFLADVLLESSHTDLASKEPQPGFQRRSPIDALPTIYMEFLIGALNTQGAFHKAENLLSRCQTLIDTSYMGESEKTRSSIQLLTAHMVGCSKQKQFKRVDDCWNMIVTQAVSRGRQLLQTPVALTDKVPDPEATWPPSTSSLSSISLPQASDMLRPSAFFPSPLENKTLKIVPALRYTLSAPITHYIQALSEQGSVSLAPDLIEKLEKAGFALTSKNWNTYIQVLARSSDPKHQLHAFELFEAKLLPGLPPWPLLRRGKWAPKLTPAEEEQNGVPEPISRKVIEKFRPGQLVPTYLTMVYLGAALMRFQQRSTTGESMNVTLLRSRAPATAEAVMQLPYLRDRAQGVLLRGRKVKGDLVKRPRRQQQPDRSGLLGSQSNSDHVPIDQVHAYDARSTDTSSLSDAEHYGGKIVRESAVINHRLENETKQQHHDRKPVQTRGKSTSPWQMNQDVLQERLVSDAYFGEPHIASTNFATKDVQDTITSEARLVSSTQKQAALFDGTIEVLEKTWAERREKSRRAILALNPSATAAVGGGGVDYFKSLITPQRAIRRRGYPRRQRLANVRSRTPTEVRRADVNQLTTFKPLTSSTHATQRQLKAFSINKRAIQRRKAFQRNELIAQSIAVRASARRERGQTISGTNTL